MTRLQPVPPGVMDDDQRALHDDMAPEVQEHLQGFVSQDDDGALLGPFVPMLHWPAWGAGAWAYTKALLDRTVLPQDVHEVAILVVAAATRTAYELYAHERVAGSTSLSAATIATIVAGQRPAELTPAQAAAYDFAAALTRGGPVPDATYRRTTDVLGDEGTAELVFLVGGYAAVSVLLNGFAVPVPGENL